MIKRPTSITAGDIAGVYSVAKFLKFGLAKLTKSGTALELLPAILLPIFFTSKEKVNSLFPNNGRIVRETRDYNWETPYYNLITKIEMEKNKMKEQQYNKEQSTLHVKIKEVINRIKRHIRISWAYIRFLLTVQHKDGSSLGTDLLAIACIALAAASLLPHSFTSLFGSVLIEIGVLVTLVAVIEPIYVLFKEHNS